MPDSRRLILRPFGLALLMLGGYLSTGCTALEGVNVGANLPIGGPVNVGVNKTIGSPAPTPTSQTQPRPSPVIPENSEDEEKSTTAGK